MSFGPQALGPLFSRSYFHLVSLTSRRKFLPTTSTYIKIIFHRLAFIRLGANFAQTSTHAYCDNLNLSRDLL